MARQDTIRRLERLLDRAEPRLRAEFRRIIRQIKSEYTLDRIAKLIEAGRWQAAVTEIASAFSIWADTVAATFVTAGTSTAEEFLSNIGVGRISFNQVNQRAVNIMASQRLDLIRQFTQQQTAATRMALTDGITRGLNPRAQARLFRDSIGLTDTQMSHVLRYRRQLESRSATELRSTLRRALRDRRFDSVVERAARTGVLSDAQIDRMVSRYTERYIKYRSEVIARTEALRSVHEGAKEAFDQAVDAGRIDANRLERKWVTARDARVRDTHRAMNGQTTSHDGVFTSGAGNALRYPGDPAAPAEEVIQCRCVVVTRIKEASDGSES